MGHYLAPLFFIFFLYYSFFTVINKKKLPNRTYRSTCRSSLDVMAAYLFLQPALCEVNISSSTLNGEPSASRKPLHNAYMYKNVIVGGGKGGRTNYIATVACLLNRRLKKRHSARVCCCTCVFRENGAHYGRKKWKRATLERAEPVDDSKNMEFGY